MTALAQRAKLERDLYPPIAKLLKANGLAVWEQATIRAGDDGAKTADQVAWRWDDREIDAVAVEVKAGKPDVGLAQAVAYAVGFPRVYVAAEEALSEAGYVPKVLSRLGLRYIRATRPRARVELEPRKSAFLSRAARDENVGRIRLKHLWTNKVVEEPALFGKDRRCHIWGVTGTPRIWQIAVLLYPGSTHAYLSLVAESKGLAMKVATRVGTAELGAAIRSLGMRDAVLHMRRREYRFQPYYEHQRTWQLDDGDATLDELLGAARMLAGPMVGPWFEIRTNLWSHSARLTETRARHELRSALQRLRPVRDELNRILRR
jgi:hypothetical protein